MYTEEYNKRPFPFRDFLLKFIIIVVFVLFLIWLVPKFSQPKLKKDNTKSSAVFQENIEKMKNAAILYYSKKENLPSNGKKEVLTLRQLINKKIITAFKDKNGKACSVDKSYIQITSEGNEYLLKVNLECSSEKDYILTKIGSYSYCEKEICEKDLTKKEESQEAEKKEEQELPKEESVQQEPVVEQTPIEEKKEETSTPVQPQKITLYEYKKETKGVLSNWSRCDEKIPSDWIPNSNRLKATTCDTNDTTCLKQIKLHSQKEYVGQVKGQSIYATRNYYCIQTRTYTPGVVDIKWSNNNQDQALINSGYRLTGNTSVK